jgi:hypothetical protein
MKKRKENTRKEKVRERGLTGPKNFVPVDNTSPGINVPPSFVPENLYWYK